MFQLKTIGGKWDWSFEKYSQEIYVSETKAKEALLALMVSKGCKKKDLQVISVDEFDIEKGIFGKVINRHKDAEDSPVTPMTGYIIKLRVVE